MSGATVSGATVERTTWDDPRVAALREAMDAEIGPRYADVLRNVAPPPLDVADVVAVFLATVDGEPVATASLKRTGAFAEVKRVFVHAHGRRRGLASALLRAVEDEARALGYAAAHLQTGFRQPEAQRLYEREGWRQVPPFGPYAGDTVVSVTYAKPLGQPLLAADVGTAVPAENDVVGAVVEQLEALDAAGVDVAFLDDAYRVPDGVVRADAPTLAAVAAHRTHRIALVPSVTTTHTEPFHLSKVVQTLDWVTRGRAGVRLTVSTDDEEAAAFGRRLAPGPDDAWAEAADVVEASRRLWDSWEDDAEIRDVATGRFIDAGKVHYTGFTGRWFAVQGPSIVPRSPQGLPRSSSRTTTPPRPRRRARWRWPTSSGHGRSTTSSGRGRG
ncbi:LLM class flavin-dependent oxidoreductase [Xylanimonas protaetiae]|uniref:LLM class flavin-dependent oxidoreductase n=1 Tax=Xylanimonas protaetiae TaxID=2509457 RepID=UPI0013EC4018|nr:LLM class flavin-dependent oxidoreductase [Xylanimonas protaetiae]